MKTPGLLQHRIWHIHRHHTSGWGVKTFTVVVLKLYLAFYIIFHLIYLFYYYFIILGCWSKGVWNWSEFTRSLCNDAKTVGRISARSLQISGCRVVTGGRADTRGWRPRHGRWTYSITLLYMSVIEISSKLNLRVFNIFLSVDYPTNIPSMSLDVCLLFVLSWRVYVFITPFCGGIMKMLISKHSVCPKYWILLLPMVAILAIFSSWHFFLIKRWS